jgi:hypothetical protein
LLFVKAGRAHRDIVGEEFMERCYLVESDQD